jgi:hypothetical protein
MFDPGPEPPENRVGDDYTEKRVIDVFPEFDRGRSGDPG